MEKVDKGITHWYESMDSMPCVVLTEARTLHKSEHWLMHSMEIGEYTVHYNSDFSGHLSVVHGTSVTFLPLEVFEGVVAQKLRMEIISKIEQMTNAELMNNLVKAYNG